MQCTFDKSNTSKSIISNEELDNEVSNSYSDFYTEYNINYAFFEKSQIHDYSDNWDLDGDGILDRVMFVGDGAAHLNYRLLVYVSGIDDFIFLPYLYTDMPIYAPIDSLSKLPFFTVYDFNEDGNDDICFNNYYNSDTLKLIGIETTKIILNYNNKKKTFDFNNFSDVNTKKH